MFSYTLAGGAYTTQESLLQLKAVAQHLDLFTPHKVIGSLSGSSMSNAKGRGLSFAEVRHYQAGDDIRSIDWKVTARTGYPHTKLFHQEQACPYLIILDQSSSLFFGSEYVFKSVLAAQIASLIVWNILAKNDGISAIINSSQNTEYIPLGYSQRSVLQLLHKIDQYNNDLTNRSEYVAGSLDKALEQARFYARSGYSIIIISDFLSITEQTQQLLHGIATRNSLAAIMVYDEIEKQLPAYGSYNISDNHNSYTLDATSKSIRNQYADLFAKRSEQVNKTFKNIGAKFSSINTAKHTADNLLRHILL